MELQWPLMIFTLCICISAGLFGMQGLFAVLKKDSSIQLPCLLVSAVSLVIGGIASFLHLEHWDRIFNGFGHLSSGITQELIAIVVFVFVMVLYFIMLRRNDGGVPVWCGVSAIVISLVLVVVMSHSYNMAARPPWDSVLLWIYYLANAVLFGGIGVALIAALKGSSSAVVSVSALVGSIANAFSVVAYSIYLFVIRKSFTDVGYYFDPTQPTKEMVDPSAVFSGFFSGEGALLFWGGVIVVGVLTPLVTSFIARKKAAQSQIVLLAFGLLAAIIGAVCFRAMLYYLGFSVFAFY